ncbi:MAG: hypothetical protein EAZ19_14270 [Oscillatoriales cyanobacterium]|nr:MAG: hypothetical protein EAZ94_24450 [Oscillatoriales cyanobacterium]TAE20094.1 MAG: hypothetical protein EAZ93_25265 [Oscillatoriales cyanobacterium]TAG94200.1 MAG: hypothetical protein EAZ19_14270 [Oscillatoriales cyanobacterium]
MGIGNWELGIGNGELGIGNWESCIPQILVVLLIVKVVFGWCRSPKFILHKSLQNFRFFSALAFDY